MLELTISGARPYPVLSAPGLLAQAGPLLAQRMAPCPCAVVTDTQVGPQYGPVLERSLESAGFSPCRVPFPAGEGFKTGQTYFTILEALAAAGLTRGDLVVTLGGGVAGDLGGFAAATYLRGVALAHIPTSLLAMVDAAVGGKTAINLSAGKNLAGAFYPPRLVLCDPEVLGTLPEQAFRDGCGEVAKYAALGDRALAAHLLDRGLDFDRAYVIERCLRAKAALVQADEYDRGPRRLLNLGHTVAHALERCSDYALPHGQAVAVGLAVTARASLAWGLCGSRRAEDILALLDRLGLPTRTGFSAAALAEAAWQDKKRSGGTLELVVPRDAGDCVLYPLPVSQLADFIAAGL